MTKMKTSTWQVKMMVYMSLYFIVLSNTGWTDAHLRIDQKEKQIHLKGKISEALGEYESHLKGAVEYLVCGQNGKQYESIIIVEATAREIYQALEKFEVSVGTPPGYDEEKNEPTPPKGTEFILSVEWTDGDKTKNIRAEEFIFNVKTQKTMQHVTWIYSGSRIVADLESDDEDAMMPLAFMSDDIVALKRFDASALFQNPLPESEEENIYKKNDTLLPKPGTPLTLTIAVNRDIQLYVLISGKVQGVGFRNFTQLNARQLGINGYAKNLPNGTVEVVAEGNKAQVDALIAVLWKGPRHARVYSCKVDERPFTGEYKDFSIRW